MQKIIGVTDLQRRLKAVLDEVAEEQGIPIVQPGQFLILLS
jgi:hypothetical protein